MVNVNTYFSKNVVSIYLLFEDIVKYDHCLINAHLCEPMITIWVFYELSLFAENLCFILGIFVDMEEGLFVK